MFPLQFISFSLRLIPCVLHCLKVLLPPTHKAIFAGGTPMAERPVYPCPWLTREFGIAADRETGELDVSDADKMYTADPTGSHPGVFLRKGTLADLWWWNLHVSGDGCKGVESVLQEAGYFDLFGHELEAYNLNRTGKMLHARATTVATKGKRKASIANGNA